MYSIFRREFVASGSETNFLKSSYQEADSMGLPYDLSSIMHYGPEVKLSEENERIHFLSGFFFSSWRNDY